MLLFLISASICVRKFSTSEMFSALMSQTFHSPLSSRIEKLTAIGGLPSLRFRVVSTVARLNRKDRSEEHTSELQSLMRISYAVFCLKKKNKRQMPEKKSMITYAQPREVY